MQKKNKYLTAGIFVVLASIGTLYFIDNPDQTFYCPTTNETSICYSENVSDCIKACSDGICKRFYYNESNPYAYRYCRDGWISATEANLPKKVIANPIIEPPSENITVCTDTGYELIKCLGKICEFNICIINQSPANRRIMVRNESLLYNRLAEVISEHQTTKPSPEPYIPDIEKIAKKENGKFNKIDKIKRGG